MRDIMIKLWVTHFPQALLSCGNHSPWSEEIDRVILYIERSRFTRCKNPTKPCRRVRHCLLLLPMAFPLAYTARRQTADKAAYILALEHSHLILTPSTNQKKKKKKKGGHLVYCILYSNDLYLQFSTTESVVMWNARLRQPLDQQKGRTDGRLGATQLSPGHMPVQIRRWTRHRSLTICSWCCRHRSRLLTAHLQLRQHPGLLVFVSISLHYLEFISGPLKWRWDSYFL